MRISYHVLSTPIIMSSVQLNDTFRMYMYDHRIYVSLLSIYQSELFLDVFNKYHRIRPYSNVEQMLRKFVDFYRIPRDMYILLFFKNSAYGEPYLRENYVQKLNSL